MRALLGLEPLDRGDIRRKPGLVTGYAPQRFDVDRAIPLTVGASLRSGSRPSRTDIARRARGRRRGAAARAPALGTLGRRAAARGARARADQIPDLLVLDEPVRGVDYAGEAELYTLIGRLRTERGFGVLLVSHDLHVVMAQSDRVICLNRHVCCSGRAAVGGAASRVRAAVRPAGRARVRPLPPPSRPQPRPCRRAASAGRWHGILKARRS